MRLAIISDIHGNLEAFKEVLADIGRCGVDEIFCLGDNIGYGPEPEEVVLKILEHNIPCIMGNHELVVAEPEFLDLMNPTARESALLTNRLLSRKTEDYLRTLKPTAIFHDSLCVHGCPPDSVVTYLFQLTAEEFHERFVAMKEKICFAGHTHDLELIAFDGKNVTHAPLPQGVTKLRKKHKYIVNVGSVGQPRDGNNNAKYIIWDNKARRIEVRFVPYDIAATADKILALGFPEYNARRLW
jgi:predicted phosphodiesterase